MKGVQCYELFGGIALKNHAFLFYFIHSCLSPDVVYVCVFTTGIILACMLDTCYYPDLCVCHLVFFGLFLLHLVLSRLVCLTYCIFLVFSY